MAVNYITDAVRAIIGAQSSWAEAPHPVEPSEVRRFFQATMDQNPNYWDAEKAAHSRYGAPLPRRLSRFTPSAVPYPRSRIRSIKPTIRILTAFPVRCGRACRRFPFRSVAS
jgi:hypothetical protein